VWPDEDAFDELDDDSVELDAADTDLDVDTDNHTLPVDSGDAADEPPPPPNVLVILIDDLGVDKVSSWGANPVAPNTPVIDSLGESGVRFKAAYTQPSCSPTRAALLTGRFGRRFGLGRTIHVYQDEVVLPEDETTLAELVKAAPIPYATSAIGKWHVGSTLVGAGLLNPNEQGFDHYAGLFTNVGGSYEDYEITHGYYLFEKTTNGTYEVIEGVYLTTDEIDDAVDRVEVMREPWFLWLALHAPHAPFSPAPEELSGMSVTMDDSDEVRYTAKVQALDTEIGRLLESMDPEVRERTTIILLGDNGTPGAAVNGPFKKGAAKTTVYEGGVHVPMIISGARVEAVGEDVSAMVHAVDIFPTVAELAGVDLTQPPFDATERDGFSLVPFLSDPNHPEVRRTLFVERFGPNGVGVERDFEEAMMRDERWKLVADLVRDKTELYDLQGLVEEGPDLMLSPPLDADAQLAFDELHELMLQTRSILTP